MLIGVLLLAMNARGQYTHQHERAVREEFQAGPADSRAAARIRGRIRWRFCRFLLFLILVLVGSSNAVNLTDGLDGLAIGLMIIAAGAMTVLSYLTRTRGFRASIWICRARRARAN